MYRPASIVLIFGQIKSLRQLAPFFPRLRTACPVLVSSDFRQLDDYGKNSVYQSYGRFRCWQLAVNDSVRVRTLASRIDWSSGWRESQRPPSSLLFLRRKILRNMLLQVRTMFRLAIGNQPAASAPFMRPDMFAPRSCRQCRFWRKLPVPCPYENLVSQASSDPVSSLFSTG